jgi:adenylate cyclase
VANKHGLAAQLTYVSVIHCWATGEVETLTRLLGALESSGHELGLTYYRALAAQTEAAHGLTGPALEHIEACLKSGAQSGEQYYLSQVHRLKGDILLQANPKLIREAETCFREAIEIARSQEACTPELEATVSLAQLLQTQNRADEAARFLRQALRPFIRASDLRVVGEAYKLLGEEQADHHLEGGAT